MLESERAVHYTYREKYPGKLSGLHDGDQVITFTADNNCHLRIEILGPKLVRVRYAVRSYFPADFSYAINPSLSKTSVPYSVVEEKDMVLVKTDLLELRVLKDQLILQIYDKEGVLLNSDEKGFHWEDNANFGGEIVKMSKTAFVDEAFYGLGDKTTVQNLKGKRFVNWGTDEFGYTAGRDPLYKNINLYYSFHEGRCYGLYFDNSFKTHFDICHERSEILSFWAEGGEMDYYFMYGDDLLDVSSEFAKLTGVPELPPLWALGYQQSKWSYYPESRVREVTSKLRAERIPCDAIYLDIDYMDGFRCFTWDQDRFPDPEKMVGELKEEGFNTVAIIDPGIKIDHEYDIFKEGLINNYFCRRADGPYMQGKVWPGECYFPDFTSPEVREWWSGLFDDLVGRIGLAGIWTDMNEPAVFEVPSKTFPPDVRHNYDGHLCSHRKAHNVYGMQMARATQEGLKRSAPDKRPFVISRSGFAGMQRYTSTWTGDNLANWEHLFLAHMQTLRLSISGVSFCGSDVGGFIDQPSGELFVRWIQLGIFHPFFRAHSSGDHGDQEPWTFGKEVTDLVRAAVELRYKILPYMYTCFYKHILSGRPILRPLTFNDSTEKPFLINNNESGLLGDHILYSPVLKKGAQEKNVFLPAGYWYDFETNEAHKGNRTLNVTTPISKIPMFIREGAVIPLFPVMQYVGEKKIEEVTLKVYFSKEEVESEFYIDDGDGYAYMDGSFRYTKFITRGGVSEFSLGQFFDSDYDPEFTRYRLHIVGLSAEGLRVQVDGEEVVDFRSLSSNFVELIVDRDFTQVDFKF